jgi:prevent-host-death family protein
MEKIGIRELRQHASRYLARVATGESIQVTDRGRPVAMLVPVPADPWEELIASGRVIRGSGERLALDEPMIDFGFSASEELAAMREDER